MRKKFLFSVSDASNCLAYDNNNTFARQGTLYRILFFVCPTNPWLISQLYNYSASQGTTDCWNTFMEEMAHVLLSFTGNLPSWGDIWEGVAMFQNMFPVTDPFLYFTQESPQEKLKFSSTSSSSSLSPSLSSSSFLSPLSTSAPLAISLLDDGKFILHREKIDVVEIRAIRQSAIGIYYL